MSVDSLQDGGDSPASLVLYSSQVESRLNKVDAEDERRLCMDKSFWLLLVLCFEHALILEISVG
jgi:hypothetical protein